MNIDSEIPVMGAGGKQMTMKESTSNIVSINGLTFSSSSFAIMSSSRQSKGSGKVHKGLLGFNQIADYIMEIDYENYKIRFYDKSSYKYAGKGQILDIGLERYIPSIDVTMTTMDGQEIVGRALVDSGASLAANINSPTVEKYKIIENADKIISRPALGATGYFELKESRINKFQVGKYEFKNVPVTLSTTNRGPMANPNYIGMIGNNILKRFKVILDYSNLKMILEPNKSYNSEFRVNSSGLVYDPKITESNGFFIKKVHNNSPASEIGIVEGDELISINGKDVTTYKNNELEDLLSSKEGKKIELKWLSTGKVIEGSIVLRKMI